MSSRSVRQSAPARCAARALWGAVVDREAAVEARAPADRKRAVLSRRVARKVQAERARGGLREIAGDGKGRECRDPQRGHVGHGPRAAIDGDIVAERRIAADDDEVPGADRDRAARPGSEGRATPPVTVTPCVMADRRAVPRDFCFRFSRSVLSRSWFPKRPRGRKRGGHGLRERSLRSRLRLHPCGEALRRRIFARPRAPAPAAEGRVV